jgi:hypothetical protein
VKEPTKHYLASLICLLLRLPMLFALFRSLCSLAFLWRLAHNVFRGNQCEQSRLVFNKGLLVPASKPFSMRVIIRERSRIVKKKSTDSIEIFVDFS